jgi:cyclophilin family peptidyl-prolyl cis-trans isomerase
MPSTHRPQIVFSAHRLWLRMSAAQVLFLAITLAGCGSSSSDTPTLSLGTDTGADAYSNRQPEKPKFNPFPEIEVKTSAGVFVLKLDAQKAPLTVNNFLNYANHGHYNGTIFHEVYRDFIVMGGGYDEKLTPRPTEMPIRNEAHNKLKNTRGTIAMARQPDSIDSATNQFFINLADNASLDYAGDDPAQYGYCVFGTVVSGMEVLEGIGKAEVRSTEQFKNAPVQSVMIESMRQLK